ncbi:MAG: F0F1 ATP synthase subunit epsilon [Odoribacter sp.]
MRLEIISAEKVLFKGEVKRVALPGSLGRFTVLEHHAPLISTLTHGKVVYETGSGEKEVEVESGVVEVLNNRVVVCMH